MRELRFHRDVYRGDAVEESVGVFEGFARIDRADTDEHWVVRLTASDADRERRIAGELANYALGSTIRHREGGR